ncbi:MAG: acyl-CoA/acyl-ACP dehydrogenase [Rhodospirillaceae bacterium]|jgi:acyl-CoA dehydrogenase|nr:acyl-CoA/acyl-ACP dehydrogenase [Rhodospirillaceae bacterium]MBT3491753.1 acyl-CoA/acyl-ACP dehydrogenase [Rhodospirillaceae bacterium]MBT3783191.1 acyl-CoA/acyl-ACP dehydrogenase [Rhodospirillaceae bacterium]MBT3978187.1 acyl-CoA/acyl-ACP dehydrogenase [Rhodospirillaceae bacterium]MBT4168191.1 acyl-CoA/acyl-ACP dehydrogenase [Rhodospirillaceae bacterium]
MDFTLNTEQQLIYDYGGKLAQSFDHKYWLEKARKNEFPEDMWRQAADDGFAGLMVDEAYGGAGLGLLEMALLIEGLSNAGIPLLMYVVGPTMSMGHINLHGTEEQKSRYLPDAAAGKTLFCFAITEPNAGSNSMRIQSVAKPVGERFKLNGSKVFITGVDVCDYAVVVARTTPFDQVKSKTDGFTVFIVDLKAKGVDFHPIEMNMILPERQFTMFFDDVDLGPEDVLGEVGKGFATLFDLLNPERVTVAALSCGIGRFAIEKAAAYASERVVFDGPIGAYQGVQHPLAVAKTQVEMSSLIMRQAACQYDQGEEAGAASNMAKYAAAEASIMAVEAALQAHGGNGFTNEYGIYDLYSLARLMRTAPLNREQILNYIGERVLGMPRSY